MDKKNILQIQLLIKSLFQEGELDPVELENPVSLGEGVGNLEPANVELTPKEAFFPPTKLRSDSFTSSKSTIYLFLIFLFFLILI